MAVEILTHIVGSDYASGLTAVVCREGVSYAGWGGAQTNGAGLLGWTGAAWWQDTELTGWTFEPGDDFYIRCVFAVTEMPVSAWAAPAGNYGGSGGWTFWVTPAGRLAWAQGYIESAAGLISAGNTYTAEYVRQGGVGTLKLNGVAVASQADAQHYNRDYGPNICQNHVSGDYLRGGVLELYIERESGPGVTCDAIPNVTSIAPGHTITFDVATTGVPDSTTLYYDLSGTVTTDDVVGGSLTGSFVITDDAGQFTVELEDDATVGRTIIAEIYTDAGLTNLVDTAETVTVVAIAASITPAASSYNEGDLATWNISVTGVPDGTQMGYRVNDEESTASSTDIGLGSTWGTVNITGGTGTIERTITEDSATEGEETLVLDLYTRTPPDTGPKVAESSPITINDTSNSAGVTYGVTLDGAGYEGGDGKWYLAEGQQLQINVTASVMPASGKLYFSIEPGGPFASDFDTHADGITLTPDGFGGGTGSYTVTAVADETTEDTETHYVEIYLDGNREFLVATSQEIVLLDTSQAPPTYAITANTYSVDEGSAVTLTASCTTVAPGTTLYWTLAAGSTVEAADFVGEATSGELEITGGDILASSGTVALTLAADQTTEDLNLVATGTATGGTASTLEDSGAAWEVDEHAGRLVIIEDGTGAGQVRMITANTATEMAVSPDWDTAPDATSDYRTIIEFFAVELRTGSEAGPVVDTTAWIIVNDTSKTPPLFAVVADKSSVPEGGTVTFDIEANWLLEDELYYTLTGSIDAGDITGALSGPITMTETTYPQKTGQVQVTLAYDETVEGLESFTFQLRTGSTGGPIVATAGPVDVIDEEYIVTANRTILTEGQAVTFTVQAVNASPSDTHAWILTGSVDSADFVEAVTSGTVTLSGGVGTITLTLAEDATADGGEFFYLELRRDTTAGAILAVSPAVVTREAAIDYDAWLGSLDGTRILLVEMQHSAGWVYFGNYPYTSYPDDTNPHRPYDDLLWDAVDIETRMDGVFTVGEVAVVNDGGVDAWATYDFRGYPIRFLLGGPDWSLDDFRLVALATNGGIDGIERGLLRFAAYDAKAIFAQPLQTTLLSDGTPVPIAIGKPFNVAPALIDRADHEYQVHEGAIISVTPRDNGADVASTDTLGSGTFELSAAPQGSVSADVVTSIQTPSAIISWLCSRYSVSVDGDTLADLPAYDIGLYYDSQASGADVLNHVCQSIGGYWLRGASGTVEVYILEEPDTTPDLILEYPSDIAENGLRLIATEDPVKTLTLNYKRNWSPVSRDSIAGSVITGDPDFADSLTEQWRSVSVTNTVTDHPLAQDRTINTYLTDPTDAATEAARIADLVSVRRERWEVEAFISQAGAQVGKTVQINYPGWGFESGRNARIVSVSRALSRGRVILEVWL